MPKLQATTYLGGIPDYVANPACSSNNARRLHLAMWPCSKQSGPGISTVPSLYLGPRSAPQLLESDCQTKPYPPLAMPNHPSLLLVPEPARLLYRLQHARGWKRFVPE